ncbi:MAG: zeta toxin family protein [Methylococcales bacterium]|nr:zeta toxin family protein [Methylococcales bacterium]
MGNTKDSAIEGDQQLKKLRTALAVSQGTRLLQILLQKASATVSHNQTKRVSYLIGLFSEIHREIFHHWQHQAIASHRPGTMPDAKNRQAFRQAIEKLVLDDNRHKKTAIFDNNGFVIRSKNIAKRLAKFYFSMRSIRPFDYGNRITLDFFMTVLGKLPAFNAVYGQGIDFRRLNQRDSIALHDSNNELTPVIVAFEHALQPKRNKNLLNKANGYGKWPENKKYIAGLPFLSHTTVEGIECLVAINGGLVPLALIKKDLDTAGKHLADYPLCETKNIIGYLPNTEDLRHPDRKEIDGVLIGEKGEVPLFCLDINILTGLSSVGQAELNGLLKECAGNNTSLLILANNKSLKNRLLRASKNEPRLQRTVEIACERIDKMAYKLETAKYAIFRGKTADKNPKLFVSMGGAGSGKTAVEEMAQAQCGENFVVASLDEFRKRSDLYSVLTAANHHSDDYVYVEPFANFLRDMVAKHAKDNHINLLYDGTGIPFIPRYSTIIEAFKKAGFESQVIAVDAFIVKPEGREKELTREGIISSVKSRYEQTGRALPWVITVYKHLRAPRSFLYAIEEMALGKISLFANDGGINQHYLVAESFDVQFDAVEVLQKQQLNNSLCAYLKAQILSDKKSILKNLAQDDPIKIEQLMARNPNFVEKNVAYQVYGNEKGSRVLCIYNARRMVDFVEKRQLNPNASGEEGLRYKIESLAFHVDPKNKEPWMIRLQGSNVA